MNTVKNPIVIIGSSRSDGHTVDAVNALVKGESVPIIELLNLNISYYDYANENSKDDFMPLAEQMIQHNPIILATPVYWYSMSAPLKTFLDRWSDLMTIRKDLGRNLANKELYVIASYGNELPQGFEDAFFQTCDYLEMQYKGCYYHYSGKDPQKIEQNRIAATQFSTQIFS